MESLEIGATYYRVTYADPGFTMPGLKPMVYVGKNIAGDESEDMYYFQDTISVQLSGLLGTETNTEECKVSTFTENEIGKNIVRLEEAFKIIGLCLDNAKKLGFPKLNKKSKNPE